MRRGRKVAFVIIFLVILGVLFLLFLLTFIIKPSTSTKQPPSAPTISAPVPTRTSRTTSLEIVEVSPDVAGNNLVRIDKNVTIIFNRPLNPEVLIYELNPTVTVATELDSSATKFSIGGDPFWPKDQTFTLTIKAGTQAQDGSTLKNDYAVTFKTGIPEGM